jgi:hypothetical protein
MASDRRSRGRSRRGYRSRPDEWKQYASGSETYCDCARHAERGSSPVNRRRFVLSMIAGPLAAQQSGLGGPVLGYLLDGEGHVRPLIGPAGSAYLAPPLAAEVALREWVGRYGLDQEGQLYFRSGARDLRRVETEAGWRNLIGSSRPDVALVRSGGRVAIVRTGVAGAAFELGMDVQHLAIDSYGEAVAGADSERVALWRADGSMVFQTPLAQARALQVLPAWRGPLRAGGKFLRGQRRWPPRDV